MTGPGRTDYRPTAGKVARVSGKESAMRRNVGPVQRLRVTSRTPARERPGYRPVVIRTASASVSESADPLPSNGRHWLSVCPAIHSRPA
ncbi:hypothetical protein SUDANB146_02268 [Streptomyces sp. enrichment culture]